MIFFSSCEHLESPMNKFLQKEHSTPMPAKYLFGRRTEQEACL